MTGSDDRSRASALQVARAVLSAFFGVRKRDDHEAVRLTPVQVIVAGIVGAALFVGSLAAAGKSCAESCRSGGVIED